jgi:hypothetical protein
VADPKKSNPFIPDAAGYFGGQGAADQAFAGRANFGAQELHRNIGVANQLSRPNGLSFNEIARMHASGGAIAQQMGFSAQLGGDAALQATAFGQQFGKMGGGAGLDQRGASRIDQELRLSAANSPLANAMGAAMAMSQAGIKSDLLSKLHDPKQQAQALNEIGMMGPAGLEQQLRKDGVNPQVISQFMNAKGANKEQIEKFGIANEVRKFQGLELSGAIQSSLANSLGSSFRGKGGRGAAMEAAGGIETELRRLASSKDPKEAAMLSDPAQMGKLIDKLQEKAGGNVDREHLAGAVRGLQEQFKSDPAFKRLGGLDKALALNRGEVVGKGGDAVNNAKADADRAEKEKKPDKELMGPPAPVEGGGGKGGGGGGGGQGGALRIEIATLTLNGNGGAVLEGPAQGAG